MNFKHFQNEVIQLLNNINSSWEKKNCDPAVFPEICSTHLHNFNSDYIPNLKDVGEELPGMDLPAQTFNNMEFSDFPLTLARNELFCIDLYFWDHSDTGVHDHHFMGAFKIIDGSSMQIQYEFLPEKEHGSFLTEGKLKQTSCTNLNRGDVQPIQKYENFIHQIFHIELPTITLCVRTHASYDEMPLSVYLYPKYKIQMKRLELVKHKWLLSLAARLKLNQAIIEQSPLTMDETANVIYKYISKREMIHPQVFDYLIKQNESKEFFADFIAACKQAETNMNKLKKLAIITFLESKKQSI